MFVLRIDGFPPVVSGNLRSTIRPFQNAFRAKVANSLDAATSQRLAQSRV